ncbi:MAG: hypothetical protein ACI96N_003347 [Arenicella sp.]|jgi:hypothetical protein
MRNIVKTIALSILMVSINTFATTVPYQNLDQLIDNSHHTIGGIIHKIKPKREKNGDYYTTVVLKNPYIIDENGDNYLEKRIKIRFKGGEETIFNDKGKAIGSHGSEMSGAPEFIKGQEVILFVSHNGEADMPIQGWTQGRFNISKSRTIKTNSGNDIVGIQNANLVILIDGKPTIKGKPVNSNTTHHISQQQSSEKPEIVGSDGGENIITADVQYIVSNLKNKPNLSLHQSIDYSEMNEEKFKSIITERKAIRSLEKPSALQNKLSKNRGESIESLYNLPKITTSSSYPASAIIKDKNLTSSSLFSSQKDIENNSLNEIMLPVPQPKTNNSDKQ